MPKKILNIIDNVIVNKKITNKKKTKLLEKVLIPNIENTIIPEKLLNDDNNLVIPNIENTIILNNENNLIIPINEIQIGKRHRYIKEEYELLCTLKKILNLDDKNNIFTSFYIDSHKEIIMGDFYNNVKKYFHVEIWKELDEISKITALKLVKRIFREYDYNIIATDTQITTNKIKARGQRYHISKNSIPALLN